MYWMGIESMWSDKGSQMEKEICVDTQTLMKNTEIDLAKLLPRSNKTSFKREESQSKNLMRTYEK